MATFTLSDLRNEVSKKYAPTVIENGKETFTLQNMLQLPSKKRNEVMDLVDKFENDDEAEGDGLDAQLETFRDIIVAVEANDKGEDLLELLGDNPALLLELATSWMGSTQLGEAERS